MPLLLAVAALVPVGSSLAAAQSPSGSPVPAPTGIAAGPCAHGDELSVRFGRVELFPRFLWRAEDPRTELTEDGLDVLGGQDVAVTVSYYDEASERQTQVPIDSLQAILNIGAQPPLWLTSSVVGTTASMRLPDGTFGTGILAVRLEFCDGWISAGASPVTVSDPARASDCPTDHDGLRAYLDGIDRQTRVGGRVVPSVWIPDARTRFTGLNLYDSGEWSGLPYDPRTPVVRARAGSRIDIRPVDPEVQFTAAHAYITGPPPASELRDGFVHTLGNGRSDTDPRLGPDGISVRMPSRPGRYLLVVDGPWRDRCIETIDAAMLVMLDVR